MTEIAAAPDPFALAWDEQGRAVLDAVAELVALDRPITVDDLLQLPDGPPHPELIDGELRVHPPPPYIHQNILANLLFGLTLAAPPPIKVLPAPLGFRIGDHNVVEPDIVVIAGPPTDPRYLDDTPLLCVEILSPSTRRMDTVRKRLLFQERGVQCYWIIDPAAGGAPNLLALELRDGSYHGVHDSTDPFEFTQPFPVTVDPGQLLD